jgi:hypothetical protein
MDTKFWGPSGWRILHLIATGPNAAKNLQFWETLPFVLPCKFCRASLTDYYEELPVPTKQAEFAEWLYKIHNKVNHKLRTQGQTIEPDPTFKAVQTRYTELLSQGCTKTVFPGWELLFCIADNHPSSSPSKPMPDTPSSPPTSLKERNRYNLLTPNERKAALRRFWTSLPDVLPFAEWITIWNKAAGSISNAVQNRRTALAWLWKIRCAMNRELHTMSQTNFYGLCKTIREHRSGCSSSVRAKTCRAMRGGKRKTRSSKQRV